MADNNKLVFGDNQDLRIYHDGSNSFIKDSGTGMLRLQTNGSEIELTGQSGGEYLARFIQDGAVELYFNNSKKIETTNTGVAVNGNLGINGSGHLFINTDSSKAYFGAGQDLQIYHDGTKSYIDNNTGDLEVVTPARIELQGNNGSSTMARYTSGGAVELFHNNNKKFETTAGGAIVTGDLDITGTFSSAGNIKTGTDTGKFFAGASNDLQIYHDGTYNVIKGTGNHRMDFYTNGTLRTCIQSDGHLRPASNNTYDLGTSVDRWRNIYTNDLNLSNEGSSNDMDGTWGNWTIQEGESDLFLKNNRSGKKYKFNLTEVS
jgi:hypothetical protein